MKIRRLAEVGGAIGGILGMMGCAAGTLPDRGSGDGGAGATGSHSASTGRGGAASSTTVVGNNVSSSTGFNPVASSTTTAQGGVTSSTTGQGVSSSTSGVAVASSTQAVATVAAASSTTGTGGFMTTCTPGAALISDMEDGNPYYGVSCPKGEWFLAAGGTPATLAPAAGAVIPVACTGTTAPGSMKCVHVSGAGQANMTATSYDASVSLTAGLNQPSATAKGTLDATAYTGVKFWGKVSGSINVQVSDSYTDPAGGMCGGVAGQCYDHPEMPLAPSAGWMPYMIPFASLTQEKFGLASPVGASFPKSAIYAVVFHVVIPATGPTPAWDLWVDDLTFY